jgi:hypothetical protein
MRQAGVLGQAVVSVVYATLRSVRWGHRDCSEDTCHWSQSFRIDTVRKLGRLDLTVEHIVLDPAWAHLFNERERDPHPTIELSRSR